MAINKKVLVTGAGGFIGSHLVERLVALGYEVKAFVRYNSQSDWGWLEKCNCKNDIEIFSGDIVNYDCVYEAVKGIDMVFHLAALIGIPYSYVSPLSYIKVNVEGTYNILQAARSQGIEKVIQTSTSEVYGTALKVPIDEQHPLQPQSPYSATKISADNLALSFFNSFDLPVTIVRPFNTFGPRQSLRAVIPTIITQVIERKKNMELGSLTPTRDLNYVKDTVEGFVKLAECKDSVGRVVNVCSNAEISVGELAEMIKKLMGSEINIFSTNERLRPKSSEVERLYGDNRLLKELTSWSPGTTLSQGLNETIAWYSNKNNIRNYKTEIYNI